ncbi:MAG: glycosyltransferase [Candidatus Portnoybacteria bacterium]|nr:glycosyltransferase [Candidatus Portnoybacteria bacterium]
MKYSIIIAASRNKDLVDCLDSIKNLNFPKDDFETIILADEPLKLETSGANIKFFSFPEKTHPSYKRNYGAANAQDEFFCFLDDDTKVPKDWLANIAQIVNANPKIIVAGPNRDSRKDFKYRIANIIQESPLTEGLHSHSKQTGDFRISDHHNMPLCNLIVPRKIFDRIHGFNETASYFMDDVEFCYIASKLGYELRLCPSLEIQHNIRPLLFPYLKYKFKTRYQVGKNFLLFPECYLGAKQIWLVGISYLFLLSIPVIGPGFFLKIATFLAGIYLLTILTLNLKHLKNPIEYLAIVALTIKVHFLSWLGFTLGLLEGLIGFIFDYGKIKKILSHKKLRYTLFKNQ